MAEGIGVVAARPGDTVNLLAGQLVFGPGAAGVRTLLGSCVAITLWHAQRRIGGMCHYLLPGRARAGQVPLDARFGDEAMALMLQDMARLRLPADEVEATISGGADTMAGRGASTCIGERNIELAWHLVDRCGFRLGSVDVGDDVPRHVWLDLMTGRVLIRRCPPIRPAVAPPGPTPGVRRTRVAARSLA